MMSVIKPAPLTDIIVRLPKTAPVKTVSGSKYRPVKESIVDEAVVNDTSDTIPESEMRIVFLLTGL